MGRNDEDGNKKPLRDVRGFMPLIARLSLIVPDLPGWQYHLAG
jgi:hypothetical protein